MNGLVNPHRIHLVIYLKNANHHFGVYLMPMLVFYMTVSLLFYCCINKNSDTHV